MSSEIIVRVKPSPDSPAKTISDLLAQSLPHYISELPPHLQNQQNLLQNIEESLLLLFLRASWANLQLSCSFTPNFLRENVFRGNRQSEPSLDSPAKTISDLLAQRLLIPDYISELPPHLQRQQSLLQNIEESLGSFFLRASWANLQLTCSFAPNFLREFSVT
ncbi:hypothetical protein CDAR_69621 [Caerostris darwini]|uniref:Uncharacterized protein n=1 Tax=Caerostris darwini TaxID=1538125 RepID=A0AAV4U0Q2_9ARAC|nr:hypothetical protein CDAR_69621 [Caerostris darwini]